MHKNNALETKPWLKLCNKAPSMPEICLGAGKGLGLAAEVAAPASEISTAEVAAAEIHAPEIGSKVDPRTDRPAEIDARSIGRTAAKIDALAIGGPVVHHWR